MEGKDKRVLIMKNVTEIENGFIDNYKRKRLTRRVLRGGDVSLNLSLFVSLAHLTQEFCGNSIKRRIKSKKKKFFKMLHDSRCCDVIVHFQTTPKLCA